MHLHLRLNVPRGGPDGCANADDGGLGGQDGREKREFAWGWRRGVVGRREVLGEAADIAARVLEVGEDAAKGHHQRLEKFKRHRAGVVGKKAHEVARVVVGRDSGIEKLGGGQAVGVGDEGLAVVKEAVFDDAAIGLVADVVFEAGAVRRIQGREVRRVAGGVQLCAVGVRRLDAERAVGIREVLDGTGRDNVPSPRISRGGIPGQGEQFGTQVNDHLRGRKLCKVRKVQDPKKKDQSTERHSFYEAAESLVNSRALKTHPRFPCYSQVNKKSK